MNPNPTLEKTDGRLAMGTIIDGRYQIVGYLGRGGFAHVYKARHVHLEREIALKVLEIPTGPGAQQFQARFLQEARIAAKIKHPNVVDVFDFGVANDLGQPYLAMDYLAGHDLEEELVRNGPMAPDRVIRLFVETLGALGEGHRMGIVHKDLKPSNLYLCNPGEANERLIILDFGIARVFGEASSQMTQSGSFTGTPAYLAPEYIESQIVTPALDVYQMGLILIETLTATPAVSAGTSMAYLLAHCQGHITIPPTLESTELGAILKKATQLKPEDRYPSATEFCEAVKTAQVPSLPFVGNRKMPLGFGNRGRLDSINVLGETTENTPALAFESAVIGVPADVPNQMSPPLSPPSNLRLITTLAVLAVFVVAGVAVLAALREPPVPIEIQVDKPVAPVSIAPTEPTKSALVIQAVDGADVGVDVEVDVDRPLQVVKPPPERKTRVPAVKIPIVPKVAPKEQATPVAPVVKPDEDKSVPLIAP